MPILPFGVVITAAGSSNRFQQNDTGGLYRKKEFELLDDRSVLYHATFPFLSIPSVCALVVTYPRFLRDETELALDNIIYTTSIPVVLVEGGETRQQSVMLALEKLQTIDASIELAAIHDGARPWVTTTIIVEALATASVFGGAAPVTAVADALKRLDENGCISESVSRDAIVAVQTPQVFRFPAILEAHRKAALNGRSYLDDTAVFSDHGGRVAACAGHWSNRKITMPQDLDRIMNHTAG